MQKRCPGALDESIALALEGLTGLLLLLKRHPDALLAKTMAWLEFWKIVEGNNRSATSKLSLFKIPYDAEATFVQSTRTQGFLKISKPSHVGIHWNAFAEHPQMSYAHM